jgi:hypothetical protein
MITTNKILYDRHDTKYLVSELSPLQVH